MLVCTLGKQIALSSQINFKLWLVANNVTIDTFIGTPIITLTDTSIVTLKYEFKTYYFALVDLSGTVVASGVTMSIGIAPAVYDSEN